MQAQNAQSFLKVNNTMVSVYKDSLTDVCIHTIMNDTLFEHYYEMTLLEQSKYRFYVRIRCVSQYNSPQLYGWVDKSYCGVYISSGKDGMWRLYSSPDKKLPYILLPNEKTKIIEVLAFEGRWLLLKIECAGKIHKGWILDYCSSIYSSCT